MPSPNTIQFSLSAEIKAKLESLAIDGESIGLTAKRILLEAIGEPIERLISKSEIDGLKERIEALESKFENVITDRDRLLVRIAESDNRHLDDLRKTYDEANALNVKLEKEINGLNAANIDLERQNQFLEEKLYKCTGIDVSDPKPEEISLQPAQKRELKEGYLVYWDEGIEIEKFWTGRAWTDDLSKVKIYSQKGAASAISQLNKKGAKATHEYIGNIYDSLADEKQAIANLYWIKENG